MADAAVVKTLSVDVPLVVLLVSVTVPVLKEQVGGSVRFDGDTLQPIVTAPVNPVVVETVITELAVWPGDTVAELGFGAVPVRVKSALPPTATAYAGDVDDV